MPKKKVAGLTVTASDSILYIQVPSDRAMDLQRFLRAKGIATSPPSPYTSGIDTIELRRGTDVEAVEAMLEQWSKPRAAATETARKREQDQ